MKILQIDNKYINTDHIVAYEVQQNDRDPERIITLVVYLTNGQQVNKSFFTKTYKLSRNAVQLEIAELLCDDETKFLNFYNICSSLEGT